MYLIDRLAELFDRTVPEAPKPGSDSSLAGLIAWLKTKPRNEDYNYIDPSRCVLGQYAAFIGVEGRYHQTPWYKQYGGNDTTSCHSNPLEQAAFGDFKWTFGKALKRFKALQRRGYA